MASMLPPVVLAIGLVAATAPAWRPLLLGLEPTIDELLSLRCSSP